MDSVTQIALGASIAELLLGKKLGNKAALIGAACATLPDLDSFIPYKDAIASVSFHRSFSHSVFVLALLSPLIALLLRKLSKASAVDFKQWWVMVFLVLITHPILDCFTVYGTQIFWPFVDHAYSGSSIFIIDPAYTLPLALGVLCALFMHRQSNKSMFVNVAGLSISCVYLAWTVGAKFYIEGKVKAQLSEQGLAWSSLLSTPAPFNTVLWRVVIMTQGGYFEAYYSVLDVAHKIDFEFIADEKHLLEPLMDHWPVQRLQWFTQGFYSARRSENKLVMSDLRMGVEGAYTFNYQVAEYNAEVPVPITSSIIAIPFKAGVVSELIQRTMNPIRN